MKTDIEHKIIKETINNLEYIHEEFLKKIPQYVEPDHTEPIYMLASDLGNSIQALKTNFQHLLNNKESE